MGLRVGSVVLSSAELDLALCTAPEKSSVIEAVWRDVHVTQTSACELLSINTVPAPSFQFCRFFTVHL